MSGQAFEWKLTPTERRIAEAAYADSEGGAWRAVQKIMHLRGERGPWDGGLSLAMNNALLDELRREPASPCDEHDYRITRLVEGGKQMRFLLEALVACDNVSASAGAIEAIIAAARKELGR